MAGAKGVVKALNDTSEKKGPDKFQKEREADAKIVRGKFINRENPGASLTFHYKKYKGEPLKTYRLIDGNEYDLPVGVIKHLVNNCQVEETTNEVTMIDPNTYEPLYANRKIPRFTFITSEFLA